MAEYGKYEAGPEIARNSRTTVFAGGPAGSIRARRFVIKAFLPVALPGQAVNDRTGTRKFIEAYEAQKTATSKRAKHWAPLVDAGEFLGGAYYVTRRYPKSLERLIDLRVKFTSESLYHVMHSVVAGLRELEQRGSRAHGNLKPSNIFVVSDGLLLNSRIVLSDPLPVSELGAAGAGSDLKSLGSILFRMVRQRDVKGDIGWPVTDSADWQALGANGEKWRDLCNTLLDPQAASRGLTLEEVEGHLDQLKFRGAHTKLLVLGIGGPVTVLLAAFAYLRFTPYDKMPERLIDYAELLGNVPPDSAQPPAEWALLCTATYDWFGVIQNAVKDPDRQAAWARDPVLQAKIIDPLNDAAKHDIALDPRTIAGVSGSLQNLAAHPPDVVKKGAIRYRILRAWKVVGGIQSALDTWPVEAAVQLDAKNYASRGWDKPAAELRAMIERNKARQYTSDAIDEYLATSAQTVQADAAYLQTERHGEALNAAGDPVLAGLADFYRLPAKEAPDVAGLEKELAAANQKLVKWVSFAHGPWTTQVDRVRLEKESAAVHAAGPVTTERFEAWQRDVADYTLIGEGDDPRKTATLAAAAADIDRALAQYRTEEKNSPPSNDSAVVPGPVLADRVKALSQDLAALMGAPVVHKDLPTLRSQIQALAANQRQMADQISSSMVLLHPDVGDWMKRLRQPTFADTPVVEKAWQDQVKLLLGSVNERALANDPDRFRTLRTEARAVEDTLRAVSAPQNLSAPELPAVALEPDLRAQLEAWLRQRRDAALTATIAGIDWNAVVHGATPQAAVDTPAATAARSGFQDALHDAGTLAAALHDLQDDLAAGRGWEEGLSDAAGRATAPASTSGLLHEGAIGARITAAEHVHQLGSSTDRAALVAAAGGNDLSPALAAWRRLGALGTWPATPAELESEASLARSLQGRLAQADSNADRQAKLAAEFKAQAAGRWHGALRAASALQTADVQAVFARMADFGVGFEALSEPERYDFYLNRLKTDSASAATSEAVNAARQRFATDLAGLPTLASDSAVQSFNTAIQHISLVKGNPAADLVATGPGSVGWTAKAAADASSVTYTWAPAGAAPQKLTFVLVELQDSDPYFLCTTAMPVGLFLDLISSPKGEGFVAAQMPSWVGSVQSPAEDQRQGPRVWNVDYRQTGHLRLSNQWNGVRMPSWPDEIYTNGTAIAPPGRMSPVQYIDPAAARAFAAQLLGSRLPTPSEWTETLIAEGGADKLHKLTWNFRDRTWETEQAYLNKSGAAFDLPWPDSDCFAPAKSHTPRGGEAVATSKEDDGLLWFGDVDRPTPGMPFCQLLGNIAIFLYDPKTSSYHVAGGSALSPPQVDPLAIYAVDTQQAREGYSDVGFRPAFSAPDSLVGKSRLARLIRDQGFLRL